MSRLLLVATVVAGVLTMHAMPVVCSAASDGGHSVHMSAQMSPHGSGPPAVVGPEHDRGTDCGDGHALAACLAVLVLGLILAGLRLAGRSVPGSWFREAAHPRPTVVGSRAPPPVTSVRLAQLCVSWR
jgi:hypothetical protein